MSSRYIEKEVIGKVSCAEGREPTSTHCYIWIDKQFIGGKDVAQPGNVFEIVEGKDDRCFGIAEEARYIGNLTPIKEYYSFQGKATSELTHQPMNPLFVKVRVLRRSGIVAPARVAAPAVLADSEGVKTAFELPSEGICVGLWALPSGLPERSDGKLFLPVYLPVEYVFGPEAAHIAVAGKTGFTKTSQMLVMFRGFVTSKMFKEKTTVILFNTKKDDLLWLDKPNPELTDKDRVLYEKMGVPPTPFPRDIISYHKPHLKVAIPSLREEAKRFSWEWTDIKNQVYLGVDAKDWDDKLEAVLADLADEESITSFYGAIKELEKWLMDTKDKWAPRGHHTATIRKTVRVLKGMKKRFMGIIGGNAPPLDWFTDLLDPGHIRVLDISHPFITAPARRLIICKIARDIQFALERRTGVTEGQKVILVVDEFSKLAPIGATGPLRYVRDAFKDIAERGRSMGVVLQAIQQYISKTAPEVHDNVSTCILMRTKPGELSDKFYKMYSPEQKEILSRLPKGLALVEHDAFLSPFIVKFPRPPCAQKKPSKT